MGLRWITGRWVRGRRICGRRVAAWPWHLLRLRLRLCGLLFTCLVPWLRLVPWLLLLWMRCLWRR